MSEIIGLRVDQKQYFHPHYLWKRTPNDLSKTITIGHIDTIDCTPIKRLADLASEDISLSAPGDASPFTTTNMSLILNSFINDEISELEVDRQKIAKPLRVFRVFIEVYLSAVTVDFLKRECTYHETNSAMSLKKGLFAIGTKIKELANKLQSVEEEAEAILYQSIGAQDYVVEIRFDKESFFSNIATFVMDIRNLDFKAVFDSNEIPNHHLFSQVNAIVSLESHLFDPQKSDFDDKIVIIHQKTRIAPGHEYEFMAPNPHVKSSINIEDLFFGFESKNLHLRFSSGFSGYLECVNNTITAAQQNTGSSRSELFIPVTKLRVDTTPVSSDHVPISVSPQLEEIIANCISSLLRCKENKLLSKSQYDELSNLTQSTIQGLARNDKQIYLIDLIPFLIAIPRYIEATLTNKAIDPRENKAIDPRENKAIDPREKERFLISLEKAINLLNRAVGNRIEELSSFRDPMAPSNRTLVAPKLISAYSTCARYAWNNLLKNASRIKGDSYACAFVGASGKIVLHAPLASHLEKISHGVPRLLFFELSGPMLYRPEVVFLNTIHEISEESEWLNSHGNPIFVKSRQFFLQHVLTFIQEEFKQHDSYTKNNLDAETKNNLLDAYSRWISSSTEALLQGDSRILAIFTLYPFIYRNLRNFSVEGFFKSSEFDSVFHKIQGAITVLEGFLYNYNCFAASESHAIDQREGAQIERRVAEKLKSDKGLITESFADFSMLLYLAQARTNTNIYPDTCQTKLSMYDAKYVSSCLLENLLHATPSNCGSNYQIFLEPLTEFFHRSILIFYICLRCGNSSSNTLNYESIRLSITNAICEVIFANIAGSGGVTDQDYIERIKSFVAARIRELINSGLMPYDKNDDYASNWQEESCLSNFFYQMISEDNSYPDIHMWMSRPDVGSASDLEREFLELWNHAIVSEPNEFISLEGKRIRFLQTLWCESTIFKDSNIFEVKTNA